MTPPTTTRSAVGGSNGPGESNEDDEDELGGFFSSDSDVATLFTDKLDALREGSASRRRREREMKVWDMKDLGLRQPSASPLPRTR